MHPSMETLISPIPGDSGDLREQPLARAAWWPGSVPCLGHCAQTLRALPSLLCGTGTQLALHGGHWDCPTEGGHSCALCPTERGQLCPSVSR